MSIAYIQSSGRLPLSIGVNLCMSHLTTLMGHDKYNHENVGRGIVATVGGGRWKGLPIATYLRFL